MKRVVALSLVAALSGAAVSNVQASDLPVSMSNSSITPDKIEYITSEKGHTVPVIYIDDPEKAQKFMEQNGFTQEPVVKEQNTSNKKAMAAVESYELMEYVGPTKYQYKVDYTENRTKEKFTWVREISRSASSETSITVGGEFKGIFKSEVGQKWNDSENYKDTFTVNIPAGKQGEIWTWNNANVYKFRQLGLIRDTIFTATLVSKDFGNSIIVTNFRNPKGNMPK
ncbi:hypothetical protein EEL32_10605 [Brevibacillus laterosporus]|nr:hypothetical protein EEL32_10605 [Brevibacillus laterosporus]